MQTLTPSALLELWERGARLHPIDRALLILDRACAGQPGHAALVELPLGQRDRLLLEAHRHCFGDALDAFARCPNCQEGVELAFSCSRLLNAAVDCAHATSTLLIQGHALDLRCPNSADLAAAASCVDVAAARKLLLARCAARATGVGPPIELLPEPIQSEIAAALANLDPHAETWLALSCPACGHAWRIVFEIATFVWTQVRTRARRLLQDVDVLARTYGWREADVLGLSEVRRAQYVEMAVS